MKESIFVFFVVLALIVLPGDYAKAGNEHVHAESGEAGHSQMEPAHAQDESLQGAEQTADEKTVYVCPMHPEVRQQEPGNCSICGMFLEQVEAAEEEQESAVEVKEADHEGEHHHE